MTDQSNPEKGPVSKKTVKKDNNPKVVSVDIKPFNIKDIELKAKEHASDILTSVKNIIVHDAKQGLKEAEVWLFGNEKPKIAALDGTLLTNVTHILTINKK